MSSIWKVQRLLQILELLQSGRRYHTRQLAQHLGVSKRTIFRDLRVLQDSGVHLEYDHSTQGYWIPISTTLPPTELSSNEIMSLLVLAECAGNTAHGIPYQFDGRNAAQKLISNLSEPIKSHISRIIDHVYVRIEPMNHRDIGNIHYVNALHAIGDRRKLRLTFAETHSCDQVTTLFSPYGVVYRDNSWYLVGRSSLHRNTQTLSVGRIIESCITSDSYDIPPRFSLDKYFGNAWRILREKPKVEVVVRFDSHAARIVSEKIWHPTQKQIWNEDGSLTLFVEVDGINEVSNWILTFGEHAIVLSPQSIREKIVTHALKTIESYQRIIPFSYTTSE